MCPVHGAVEQVDNFGIDAPRVDLDPPEEFAPLRPGCRADLVESEIGDLLLGVRARLLGRDERDPYACEDRGSNFYLQAEYYMRCITRGLTVILESYYLVA